MTTQPHRIKSPFPMQSKQLGEITDEVCVCGELRSAHADTLAYGHGGCSLSGCAKFTWAGFVTKERPRL